MKMIINGNYVDASNKEVAEVRNPYNNELIDTVPFATDEDVDKAIDIAVEAQKKWNELSTYERGEIIIRFTEQIKLHIEELAVLLSKETGKIIKEARAEIKNTAAQSTISSFNRSLFTNCCMHSKFWIIRVPWRW